MIVRLTFDQQKSIARHVPEVIVEAMREHRTVVSGRQHDVLLPAIAWRIITERMRDVGYGPLGGATKYGRSFYTGLARVQKQVNRLDTHPALRGVAAYGFCHEEIPAWVSTEQGRPFTPYPDLLGQFYILTPVHEERLGHVYTSWRPRLPSGDPEAVLEHESFHRRLCVGVDTPRVVQGDRA